MFIFTAYFASVIAKSAVEHSTAYKPNQLITGKEGNGIKEE